MNQNVNRQRKVIIFIYAYLNHIIPVLKLIQKLSDFGIIVYCIVENDEYTSMIGSYGGKVIVPGTSEYRHSNVKSGEGYLGQLKKQKAEAKQFYLNAKEKAENYYAIIESLKPGLILYDTLCLQGYFIAQKLKIKSVCYHTDFVFTQQMRIKYLEDNICGNKSVKKPGRFITLFKMGQDDAEDILDQFYSQIMNIVFIPVQLQYMSKLLNHRLYKFVGYGENAVNGHLAESKEYLVYCDLGEVYYPEYMKLMCQLIEMADKTSDKVHINVRNRQMYHELINMKPNWSQAELTENYGISSMYNARYFISDGDLSYVREAVLYETVPVMYPLHFDHQMTGKQIREYGAGIVASADQDNVELIIKRLQNNTEIHKRLYSLKQLFMQHDTYREIVDIIEPLW